MSEENVSVGKTRLSFAKSLGGFIQKRQKRPEAMGIRTTAQARVQWASFWGGGGVDTPSAGDTYFRFHKMKQQTSWQRVCRIN